MTARAATISCGLAIITGLLLPLGLRAAHRDGRLVPVDGARQVATTQTTTPPQQTTPPVVPPAGAPAAPAVAAPPTTPPTPPPPKPPYAITWTKSIDATEPLELAVGSTAVLLGAGETPLSARALDDGRELWTSELSPQGALATEAGIVVFAARGALHGLDEQTGAVRWSVKLDGPSSNVTIHQGRVLHAVGLEARAYDLPTGRELWRRPLPAVPSTPFTFAGGAAFVMTTDQALIAIDEATGTERWTKALDLVPVSILAALDQVFLGTNDGAVCAFGQASGEFRWCQGLRMFVIGPPAHSQDIVYFALVDNTVTGLTPGGTKARSIRLNTRPIGGVAVAGDLLVVTTAPGEVALITTKTGAITARLAPPGATTTASTSLEIAALSSDTTRIASLVVLPGGVRTLALYSRTPAK